MLLRPASAAPASGLLLALGLLAALAGAPSARAQIWFDGGRPDTVIVHAREDSTCWELFPPLSMGPLPPLSFVWEQIEILPCEALRWPGQLCWNGAFVRGVRIEFNDGGCGCGGYVEIPTTLRLSYDRAALAQAGLAEADLGLVYNDATTRAWQPVPGARVDPNMGCVVAPILGRILGFREYAIVGPTFTSAAPCTWSGIKALYAME